MARVAAWVDASCIKAKKASCISCIVASWMEHMMGLALPELVRLAHGVAWLIC
ncbi:UNVERIFIED_CONTAM: hypothetical protein Sangu_1879200 [Sesamum angustifolium]|uniref:Uncharacterized protein n=1 Tax=Sesamum angustifolium TaxID=2727405 RepID=A0AAW2LVV7_9LAMI